MNLNTLIDELLAAVRAIDGLHTAPYPPGSPVTPLVFAGVPGRVEYPSTFGDCRALTTTLSLNLLLSHTSAPQAARDAVLEYISDTGPRSIVAAVDAGTYTQGVPEVVSVEVGEIDYAGAKYLLAAFDVEIGA